MSSPSFTVTVGVLALSSYVYSALLSVIVKPVDSFAFITHGIVIAAVVSSSHL